MTGKLLTRRGLFTLGGLAGALSAPAIVRSAIIRPVQAAVYSRGFITGDQFGALGNNSNDDTSAINAAMTAAGTTVNGITGGTVYLPRGTYKVSSKLLVPNGVRLIGDNPSATQIIATATFSDTSLIRNSDNTGGQEYCFIEKLTFNGNQGAGALCTTAVVQLSAIFINSWIRDCQITGGSAVGLQIDDGIGGGSGGTNCGPVQVMNNWVHVNKGDNILIKKLNNTGVIARIALIHNATETLITNSTNNVHFNNSQNSQGISGVHILGHHFEQQSGFATTGLRHLLVDGTSTITFVRGSQLDLLTGSAAWFTEAILLANAYNTQLDAMNNLNQITTIVHDSLNVASYGNDTSGVGLAYYATPDCGLRIGTKTLTAA